MRTNVTRRIDLRILCVGITAVIFVGVFSNYAWAYSEQMRREFIKGGPWELMTKMGQEGQEMHFPVTVLDEDASQKLDETFPVMGTPFEVELLQYKPNLEWQNTIEKQAGGGTIVSLKVKGAGLDQEMLLDSADPERRSISSSIGSVTLKKIHDANVLKRLIEQSKDDKAAGILSVWLKDANSPLEYAVDLRKKLTIGDTGYTLKVLEYFPHYSIDRVSKKVVNLSEEAVNPAIKIRVDGNGDSYEQWVWSKFSPPHLEAKYPLRVEFSDFDIKDEQGSYILAAATESDAWLIFSKDKKNVMEKVRLGNGYYFANMKYTFSIEKISDDSVIKTDWQNQSEKLLNPAVIAVIKRNEEEQEIVLELNKPFHQQTDFGTLVLLYKRQGQSRMTTK